MPTLTIHCRYPDDDEITSVPFAFATLEEAEAARAAVLERVRAGGLFYLGDEERPGDPIPFHAETVWAVTIGGSEGSPMVSG